MNAALLAYLRADATLAALLPGGIYDAQEVSEISRQNTPGAFDSNKELRPCMLIRLGPDVPDGIRDASRLELHCYSYARRPAPMLTQVARRLYQLLHERRIGPGDGDGAWQWRYSSDMLANFDEPLHAALAVSRYHTYIHKHRSTP